MADIIQWVATAATIIAASVTAANLGSRITGYGFCIFLFGSVAWVIAGLMSGQQPMVWNNAILTLLNIFGIWRWLGRQAKVEEGGRRAASASRHTPGESLFPVSLLAGAKVKCGGGEGGECVDAMAGCASGSIQYLVFSHGGVGGVGETLRRADWAEVSIDRDTVVLSSSPSEFDEVERDKWPGR